MALIRAEKGLSDLPCDLNQSQDFLLGLKKWTAQSIEAVEILAGHIDGFDSSYLLQSRSHKARYLLRNSSIEAQPNMETQAQPKVEQMWPKTEAQAIMKTQAHSV